MAEERILCSCYTGIQAELMANNNIGMTRQEAIERMAKAICNMGDEETWERVDDNYRHYCTVQAKWALNALLEGK